MDAFMSMLPTLLITYDQMTQILEISDVVKTVFAVEIEYLYSPQMVERTK